MSDGEKILAWIRDWLADGGAVLMIADYDGIGLALATLVPGSSAT